VLQSMEESLALVLPTLVDILRMHARQQLLQVDPYLDL